ncbi:hypothetical protein OAF96_01790 [bacterium]|nr:hypothetical protein [bacterium]
MRKQRIAWLGVTLLTILIFDVESAVAQNKNDLELIDISYLLDEERLRGLDLSEEQKQRVSEAKERIQSEGSRQFAEHRKKFGDGKQSNEEESKKRTPAEELARSIKIEASSQSWGRISTSQSEAKAKALLDILLPHQEKKLVPLYLWRHANSGSGFRSFLKSRFIQKKLELTPDQVESIQPVATKLQKEFDDELEMLKQKYRKRLMDKIMTKEQREIFDQAIGENIGSKSELEFGF